MTGSLYKEFERATRQGWLPFFEDAAREHCHRVEVLLGIASRETNMGGREIESGVFEWLTKAGDGGHGYGLMQIDARSFPHWVATGQWRDVASGIMKGAQVLAEKRERLLHNAGLPQTIRDRHSGETYTYVSPTFDTTDPLLERVAIAAYNSGDWSAYHLSKGRNPDRGTSGGDYSSDVLQRALNFQRWLTAGKDFTL
jgi:hypothetical protein